jgi:hypothetical protein
MRSPEEISKAIAFCARMSSAARLLDPASGRPVFSREHAFIKIAEALEWATGVDNDFGAMLGTCDRLETEEAAKAVKH